MNDIIASIIIPVYNEEKYIDVFLNSLEKQTYPRKNMEWIFVDGKSNDNTLEIIKNRTSCYLKNVKIITNDKKVAPAAMNLGINIANGKYIIRLDAHAEYYDDYVEKCVYYLDNTDADNVGGMAVTTSDNFVGIAISKMLSTRFGVGGSNFRTGDGNKYVDTVPFGAFRKEIFDKIGLFNQELVRSEDNDINSRIRECGGKIWLAEDIKFKYYCRDTISGIIKMALQNGNALFFTYKYNKKAMSLRHFIPFIFLISIVLLCILLPFNAYIRHIFILEIFVYLILDFYFSFINNEPKYGLINMWLYPAFHLTYGFGSLLSAIGIKLY